MSQFKVGDAVFWRSQAAGCWTSKVGKVVEVVPAGEKPLMAFRVGRSHGMPRKHESYIVHVETKTGKGKGKYYWPVVNLLGKI